MYLYRSRFVFFVCAVHVVFNKLNAMVVIHDWHSELGTFLRKDSNIGKLLSNLTIVSDPIKYFK